MPAESTLVIQSHRQPLPSNWIEDCMRSVSRWAFSNNYAYEFIDDALFDVLDNDLYQKTRHQIVIASDLARLRWIQRRLKEGYSAVVWCDADVLVHNAQTLQLPNVPYALGREVWVQANHSKLRCYRKVHNAFMYFRKGNAFLNFYIDSAERLVRENTSGMPAQYVGPKLLTALHNIVQCPVIENAAVVSPLVIKDLLNGGGEALQLMLNRSRQIPAAVNLCYSSVTRGEISDAQMRRVIRLLLSGDQFSSSS